MSVHRWRKWYKIRSKEKQLSVAITHIFLVLAVSNDARQITALLEIVSRDGMEAGEGVRAFRKNNIWRPTRRVRIYFHKMPEVMNIDKRTSHS